MLIDMHLHTRRSWDSGLSIDQAVEVSKAAGLDAICLTEHDTFTSEDEIQELTDRLNLPLFGGAEFTMPIGHFLVYDIYSDFAFILDREYTLLRMRKLEQELQRMPVLTGQKVSSALKKPAIPQTGDFIRQVHAAGGLVFWAHPMDDYSELRRYFNRFVEEHGTTEINEFVLWLSNCDELHWLWSILNDLDGFELFNGLHNERGLCNSLTARLADVLKKPGTAGSDAHSAWQGGTVAANFEAEWMPGMRIGDLFKISTPRVQILRPLSKSAGPGIIVDHPQLDIVTEPANSSREG
jgi:predicted metal-dependent phosphoesterase TrpH